MALLINNNFNPSILIIDDRESILTMLSYNMRRNGFIVYTATTKERALAVATEKRPHIIVINQVLGGEPTMGLSIQLHQKEALAQAPIVMLTLKAESGETVPTPTADNVITEVIAMPLDPSELVARLRAIYRKHRPPFTTKVLQFDDVVMNLASFKVTKASKEVHLGPTEFKILQCLMEFPKRILSREYIMTYVWGPNSAVEMRTIDVHINRLRSALKGGEDEPPMIETIRSAGYCLRRESAALSRPARPTAAAKNKTLA